MSCRICELHQKGFASEKEFTDFRKRITELVEKGDLENCGQIDHSGPFIKTKYQCEKCGQFWVLEFPDQAFRGGWKKLL